MTKKAVMISLILIFLVSMVWSAELRGNGYKGEFKSDTTVIASLFECKEYIRHMSAGDEGYGGNLVAYNLLDVFEKGDTFTVIKEVDFFTEIVAYHKSGISKGTSFEGWVLNEWVWKNDRANNKKLDTSNKPGRSI